MALTGIAFHQTAPAGTQVPPPPEPSRVVPAPPNDNPETAHGPSRLDQSPDAERRRADAAASDKESPNAPQSSSPSSSSPSRGQNVDITA